MIEWLKEHPHVIPTEADTVIGSISGKVASVTRRENVLLQSLLFIAEAAYRTLSSGASAHSPERRLVQRAFPRAGQSDYVATLRQKQKFAENYRIDLQ